MTTDETLKRILNELAEVKSGNDRIESDLRSMRKDMKRSQPANQGED